MSKTEIRMCAICGLVHDGRAKACITELMNRNDALQKQLRTAQEVINTHVADQVEGLHCVDCVALPDEVCDCPMLIPIFAAMEGYTEKPNLDHARGVCDEKTCLKCEAFRKENSANPPIVYTEAGVRGAIAAGDGSWRWVPVERAAFVAEQLQRALESGFGYGRKSSDSSKGAR